VVAKPLHGGVDRVQLRIHHIVVVQARVDVRDALVGLEECVVEGYVLWVVAVGEVRVEVHHDWVARGGQERQ